MKVLFVFFIGVELFCTIDGQYSRYWPISSIKNYKYIQRRMTNNNDGRYEENCPKRCSCYKTALMKVKCDKRRIPHMSDWKPMSEPRYMLVC